MKSFLKSSKMRDAKRKDYDDEREEKEDAT